MGIIISEILPTCLQSQCGCSNFGYIWEISFSDSMIRVQEMNLFSMSGVQSRIVTVCN